MVKENTQPPTDYYACHEQIQTTNGLVAWRCICSDTHNPLRVQRPELRVRWCFPQSYYLANEPGATANLWRLVAVLAAYQQAVRGLKKHYQDLQALDHQRCAAMAGLRQAACLVAINGEQVERPCTLPYSLLDDKLNLQDVSFVGPCLLYSATQRLQGGAGERAVLIKFVEGRYGQEVCACSEG